MLPPEETNLCDDFIFKEPGYFDLFQINFSRHCVFGNVLSDSNPLDNVVLWREVVQPTRKPRSIGPHKSKPTKTTSKKKTNQKNKKSRIVTVLVPDKPRSVKIQTPGPEE